MKIRIFYSYPKVTVKTRRKPKAKKRESGFYAGGHYVTRKHIMGNKWLSKAERQALLDMCQGVTVKKIRQTRTSQKCVKPVGRYRVDGVVYCDGSIEELSEFWGV